MGAESLIKINEKEVFKDNLSKKSDIFPKDHNFNYPKTRENIPLSR